MLVPPIQIVSETVSSEKRAIHKNSYQLNDRVDSYEKNNRSKAIIRYVSILRQDYFLLHAIIGEGPGPKS